LVVKFGDLASLMTHRFAKLGPYRVVHAVEVPEECTQVTTGPPSEERRCGLAVSVARTVKFDQTHTDHCSYNDARRPLRDCDPVCNLDQGCRATCKRLKQPNVARCKKKLCCHQTHCNLRNGLGCDRWHCLPPWLSAPVR